MVRQAKSRVAIIGTGEPAELVNLVLKDLWVDHLDVFGAGNPNPSRILAWVRVRPLHGYDHVALASLGDNWVAWRRILEMGVPKEKVVTLIGSPRSKRQATPSQPAGAWRDAR